MEFIREESTETPETEIPENSQETEEPELYIFYCYHETCPEKEDDNCPACGHLEDSPELEIEHENYDPDNILDTIQTSYYHRQRFDAYLRPSTRKKYESEHGMYALANLCLWNEQDEDFDDLEEDEYVEDASDDMYICYDENDREVNAYDFFRKHRVHCFFKESSCTAFAEWHDKSKHPTS